MIRVWIFCTLILFLGKYYKFIIEEEIMKNKIGYFYILLAGIFWSTLGFLVSKISDYNFSSEEIAFFQNDRRIYNN